MEHADSSAANADDVAVTVGLADWEINYRDNVFSGPDLNDLTYQDEQAIATWDVGTLGEQA